MMIGGKIKIAFFCEQDVDSIGGMETHAKYFKKYFICNDMLTCLIGNGCIEQYKDDEEEHIYYENNNELYNYLAVKGITVFFFNNAKWIEKFNEIRKKFPKVIMIMRSGGNEFMKASLLDMRQDIRKRREIWAQHINCLDYIIANSKFSHDRMKDIGIYEEKIVIIRGGVDIRKCREYKGGRQTIRDEIYAKYNIEKENKLLGCIARFETFKGIIPTLRVLNGYQNLKWHLIIAGEGSQKNQIQNYLSNNFAKNKYTFLGKLNHEEALYTISSLDMLLNLSINYSRESGQDLYIHTETMGRSMLEAVCCGVPIVASDVGGISELFLENKWIGYMMSDFQQFTMLFPSILNNKAEVKLGDEDRYDWKYIFRIYLALMADNKKIIGIEEKLDE